MTNSVRKKPFYTVISGNNSLWKRYANRELRRTNRQLIRIGKEINTMRQECNLWTSPRDGKLWYEPGLKVPYTVIRCGAIRYKVPRTDTGLDFWDTRDIFWK